MDSDRLNRWLTLGANLAVLVGLALLVIEISQNSEIMRAQTRNDISVQLVDLMSQVATSDDLSSLLSRVESGEPLSDEEQIQFSHRAFAMFRYFENVHYQYRQGMYDEQEFLAQQEAWRRFANNAAYASIWCASRKVFSPEFRAAFEALAAANGC